VPADAGLGFDQMLIRETAKENRKGSILLSIGLISGLLLLFTIPAGLKAFATSPRFLVREVEVHWPKVIQRPVERFRIKPVTSIFESDLTAIARTFQGRFPVARVMQVVRHFPNRIVVHIRPRRVVAQVRANKYYPVSERGIIVAQGRSSPWKNLPVLYANDLKEKGFSVGSEVDHVVYEQAFELCAAIQRLRGIVGQPVTSIHCQNTNLILVLESGTQIRFHTARVRRGWEQLTELLVQRREIIVGARYIDLRFDDPVIGTNQQVGK